MQSLSAVTDVDGDGIDDILIGSAGQVDLISGSTQSVLLTISQVGVGLGDSVAAIPDLDGDGKDDILVGLPFYNSGILANCGAVRVYSSATGAQVLEVLGPYSQSHLGSSVAFIGDLDSDGVPDFAAGAKDFTQSSYQQRGMVSTFSGTGQEIWRTLGASEYDRLGSVVEGLGDWNLDGVPDVIAVSKDALAYGGSRPGKLVALSGLNGREIWAQRGNVNEPVGTALATSFDLGDQEAGLIYTVDEVAVVATVYHPCLRASSAELSLASGSPVVLEIDFPDILAGRHFAVLGSFTGTGPTKSGGIWIPLTKDSLFWSLAGGWNILPLEGGVGVLDASGRAEARLVPAPGLAAYVGTTVWFAAVSYHSALGHGYLSSVSQEVVILP